MRKKSTQSVLSIERKNLGLAAAAAVDAPPPPPPQKKTQENPQVFGKVYLEKNQKFQKKVIKF